MALTKLKQLLVVLIVLLVLDVSYIVHYYHSTNRLLGSSVSEIKDNVLGAISMYHRLKKLQSEDIVVTNAQAYTILNPDALNQEIQRSLKSSSPEAVKSILLLKTHKTGSSTLQNIILRYALLHNLTIAVPIYRASFLWPHEFRAEYVRQTAGVSRYQVLAHHATLDKDEFDKILDPSAVYVTILRDSVSVFRSAYKYYHCDVSCFNRELVNYTSSPDYFRIYKTGVCPDTRIPIRNIQATDLGLPRYKMDDLEAVQGLIKFIDKTFQVVMITERFDESLLLLGKKLKWQISDLIYFKQNSQDNEVDTMWLEGPDVSNNKGLNKQIRSFNKADDLLYQYYSKRLDEQLSTEFTAGELQSQLRLLKKQQDKAYSKCVAKKSSRSADFIFKQNVFRQYGEKTTGYLLKSEALNNTQCRLMALPELMLTHYIKWKVLHNGDSTLSRGMM